MTDEREALLTVKEYALIFRRHPQTVYSAIRRGSMRFPVERPTGGGLFIRVPVALLARVKADAA